MNPMQSQNPVILPGRPQRILVDNGSYGMQNHGDVAMLTVAAKRFSQLYPEAEIWVVTDRPDRLKRAIPRAIPVPTYGHLLGPLHTLLAPIEQKILRDSPTLALLIIKAFAKLPPQIGRHRNLRAYAQMIENVDLVITSGGGYMTDDFDFYALPILEILEIGIKQGKTTAMLGQGLGPFQAGGALRAKAQAVLPRLDRVMVRERLASAPLLKDLGAAAERIAVTGDDAIEMAYRLRPAAYGNGIGVNARQTAYAQVDAQVIDQLKTVLHAAARQYKTSLIPLPISVSQNEGDFRTIRALLSGFDDASDGGESLRSPQDVIAKISECRIVVTGAYHAAVFALSCGVPAVCFAKSPYYADKLAGLADQFGDGCAVILPEEKNFQGAVSEAIEEMWERAEEVRPGLLAAAERQIATGWEGYRGL